MELSGYTYAFFNVATGILWMATAFYLIYRRKSFKPEKIFWVLLAAPAFFFFGVSDFIEAPRYATSLPYWLWAIKITCGCTILFARLAYLESNQKRERAESLIMGLILLALAFCLMFLF